MTSLVKHTLGSFLIGLSLFGACKSSETAPANQISLGLNKSARIGADLTVHVDSLNDSRCPLNVQCIWAGQATVNLSLSQGADTQKRRLIIPSPSQNRTDSTTVQFGSTQYKVILQDVTPYPAGGTSQPDKQAVIRVTKL